NWMKRLLSRKGCQQILDRLADRLVEVLLKVVLSFLTKLGLYRCERIFTNDTERLVAHPVAPPEQQLHRCSKSNRVGSDVEEPACDIIHMRSSGSGVPGVVIVQGRSGTRQ